LHIPAWCARRHAVGAGRRRFGRPLPAESPVMIREYSSTRSRVGSSTYHRLPLVALLAATTLVSVMACSSDDDGDTTTEALPLESVDAIDVPERDLPAAPEPEAVLEAGGDT